LQKYLVPKQCWVILGKNNREVKVCKWVLNHICKLKRINF
jgi:hypothetical protein